MTVCQTAEKPIIVSGPMVCAIRDGLKTQTRRVIKPQPPFHGDRCRKSALDGCWDFWSSTSRVASLRNWPLRCPFGEVGDRLWGRESFYIDLLPWNHRPLPKHPSVVILEHIYYRADGECCEQIPERQCAEVGKLKWRSPIHMSRWASRLTLEITDVRVERVQDISDEDAFAEGTKSVNDYRELWDSLNQKRGFGWLANPWVFAITFKVIQ